jgi:hypothetical protein
MHVACRKASSIISPATSQGHKNQGGEGLGGGGGGKYHRYLASHCSFLQYKFIVFKKAKTNFIFNFKPGRV